MKIFSFEVQRFANIENEVDNTVIAGTADADTIYNSGANVSIDGNGGDEINVGNSVKNTSVNAGAGNDVINNYGDNGTIFAGDGDEWLT